MEKSISITRAKKQSQATASDRWHRCLLGRIVRYHSQRLNHNLPISVVPAAVSASSQPCTWANNGVCETALTAGHYKYTLNLTLNTAPGSTTTYTVTVKWDQGSGQTQLGQLTVSVPNTATAGQVMTFKMDTGGTSFVTPLSLDVTVA